MNLINPLFLFSKKEKLSILNFFYIFGHFSKYLKFMQISVKINMSILTPADYVKVFLIYCNNFGIFLEV